MAKTISRKDNEFNEEQALRINTTENYPENLFIRRIKVRTMNKQ
jgi:hypothetical protein